MKGTHHQWRLAARPKGKLTAGDMTWAEATIPEPGPGQVLVRNIYLSLDPSTRGRLDGSMTYSAATAIGAVPSSRVIGVVAASRHSEFRSGALVQGMLGWEEYSLADGAGLMAVEGFDGHPLSAAFGVLGHIGLTAYVGLLDIGRPRAGETLVVSAAAGAVGSVAAQIGRIVGCRVVGIAGGQDKCDWLLNELGLDSAVDYKSPDFPDSLAAACPEGIDIYFDNVGGSVLDAALGLIADHGRVVVCGLISQYTTTPTPGPANFANILYRRVRVEGFLNFEHAHRWPACRADLVRWLREGRLTYRLDIVQGLENAPTALNALFEGRNNGKVVVQISEEPKQTNTDPRARTGAPAPS